MSLQLCQFMYERELNLFAHFCVDKCGRVILCEVKWLCVCVCARVWPLNNESPPPCLTPFQCSLLSLKPPMSQKNSPLRVCVPARLTLHRSSGLVISLYGPWQQPCVGSALLLWLISGRGRGLLGGNVAVQVFFWLLSFVCRETKLVVCVVCIVCSLRYFILIYRYLFPFLPLFFFFLLFLLTDLMGLLLILIPARGASPFLKIKNVCVYTWSLPSLPCSTTHFLTVINTHAPPSHRGSYEMAGLK